MRLLVGDPADFGGLRVDVAADAGACCLLLLSSGGTSAYGECVLFADAESSGQACRRFPFKAYYNTLVCCRHCHSMIVQLSLKT